MPYTDSNIGFKRTDTSYLAAVDAAKTAPTIREKVLELLRGTGRNLSTEAISAALGCSEASVQPRTSELQTAGLIYDSGFRGKTKWDKACILWTAAKPAPQIDMHEISGFAS